mmetsp:Transcript_72172/g.121124  ORF Transcript_72172/g.121124 Transcript_72172/m.121124 type:complete len:100 (-) Transcript_72172:111-410(-)
MHKQHCTHKSALIKQSTRSVTFIQVASPQQRIQNPRCTVRAVASLHGNTSKPRETQRLGRWGHVRVAQSEVLYALNIRTESPTNLCSGVLLCNVMQMTR